MDKQQTQCCKRHEFAKKVCKLALSPHDYNEFIRTPIRDMQRSIIKLRNEDNNIEYPDTSAEKDLVNHYTSLMLPVAFFTIILPKKRYERSISPAIADLHIEKYRKLKRYEGSNFIEEVEKPLVRECINSLFRDGLHVLVSLPSYFLSKFFDLNKPET